MAQKGLYGVVEVKEFERAGKTEKQLFMRVTSRISISCNYFPSVNEYFVHVNKKDKKYYLPLSWAELDELDFKSIKEKLQQNLHLLVSILLFLFIGCHSYCTKTDNCMCYFYSLTGQWSCKCAGHQNSKCEYTTQLIK